MTFAIEKYHEIKQLWMHKVWMVKKVHFVAEDRNLAGLDTE